MMLKSIVLFTSQVWNLLGNKTMSAESSTILQIVKDNGSLSFDPERLALSTCYAIRDLIRANILSNNNNTLTLCTA